MKTPNIHNQPRHIFASMGMRAASDFFITARVLRSRDSDAGLRGAFGKHERKLARKRYHCFIHSGTTPHQAARKAKRREINMSY